MPRRTQKGGVATKRRAIRRGTKKVGMKPSGLVFTRKKKANVQEKVVQNILTKGVEKDEIAGLDTLIKRISQLRDMFDSDYISEKVEENIAILFGILVPAVAEAAEEVEPELGVHNINAPDDDDTIHEVVHFLRRIRKELKRVESPEDTEEMIRIVEVITGAVRETIRTSAEIQAMGRGAARNAENLTMEMGANNNKNNDKNRNNNNNNNNNSNNNSVASNKGSDELADILKAMAL